MNFSTPWFNNSWLKKHKKTSDISYARSLTLNTTSWLPKFIFLKLFLDKNYSYFFWG
jgi:hypothetical protein